MLIRWYLFSLVSTLFAGPLAKYVPESRRDECADRTALVVYAHGGSPVDALILAEWQARESGCDPRAVSPDGQDAGVLQQRGPARHGMSAADLAAHPELAMESWLRDLDRFRVLCGSTFRALGVLSGGKCGARPALVRSRCRQAQIGVNCDGT